VYHSVIYVHHSIYRRYIYNLYWAQCLTLSQQQRSSSVLFLVFFFRLLTFTFSFTSSFTQLVFCFILSVSVGCFWVCCLWLMSFLSTYPIGMMNVNQNKTINQSFTLYQLSVATFGIDLTTNRGIYYLHVEQFLALYALMGLLDMLGRLVCFLPRFWVLWFRMEDYRLGVYPKVGSIRRERLLSHR
jgi:hypothetical protein